MKNKKEKKLYVLCDNTLKPIYAAVQGGHAVAKYIMDTMFEPNAWKNSTIVYLSCDIAKTKEMLDSLDLVYSAWREPDLDNRITAIAIHNKGYIFKNLKTLR